MLAAPAATVPKLPCPAERRSRRLLAVAKGDAAAGFLLQRKTAERLARFAITPNCLTRQPDRLIHGYLICRHRTSNAAVSFARSNDA